jgi:hypothetical protein
MYVYMIAQNKVHCTSTHTSTVLTHAAQSVYVYIYLCVHVIAAKEQAYTHQHRHAILTHRRTQRMCAYVGICICKIAKQKYTAQAHAHQCNSQIHVQLVYVCTYTCARKYIYMHPRWCARAAFDTSVGGQNAGTVLNKASRTNKVKARILVYIPGFTDDITALYKQLRFRFENSMKFRVASSLFGAKQ